MQMPSRFKQKGPDQLQVRDGGGCLALFGIPFFAAGVFVTLIGVRVIPMSNARELPVWAWPIIVFMGLVFVAVGGGLVFGRQWITIDVTRGTVLKQRGLLVPMSTETLSLRDYEAVSIRFEAGDSDSPDRYPVFLKSKIGQDLTIYTSGDYGQSRQQAVLVAEFLGFSLEDSTTDHLTILPPDQVDMSIQQRPSRREEAPRPFSMRSEVQESGTEVRITIPGPGFRVSTLIPFAIPVTILLYFGPELARFFDQTHTPKPVQMAFLAFGAFVLGFLPLMSLLGSLMRAIRGRTTVTVTSDKLTLTEPRAWRAKTTTIPTADILDLDYGLGKPLTGKGRGDFLRGSSPPRWVSTLNRLATSKGVTVKTRRGLFTFGAGLPDDEVAYLNGVVARAISAGGHR